ncbi:hypothetical protein ILUMI_08210 [Ignelater luminosus]|uniref:Uncharacterized protein n=1 Tax=Ignelater luminosus TaxID=2038154 RepID=A0A8K0GH92_IGNLU|nr:hypothetical protein ILUMI_08210 [Ignelater luminosus]
MNQTLCRKLLFGRNGLKPMTIIHETSTGELFEKNKEDFIEFLHHVSIKRIQSDAFLNDKNNPSVRILQIDFAMSYSCERNPKCVMGKIKCNFIYRCKFL